ncbi:MAG: hypothetical protein RIS94_970 [Pseudomonadota bacterium]|jgi:hypothetical protein
MPAWQIFGLTLVAPRPIAGLEPCAVEGHCAPDVTIVEAPVAMPPATASDDWIDLAAHPGGLYLSIRDVARFHVEAGRRIAIDRAPGATDAEVDVYLTGTVIGVLLHQRGLLPLHCNAVSIGGAAFLFCGDSGAGKSTLAAWFEARGHAILTDDLCAVQVGAGPPLALAGMPRLRLWRQSLHLLGRSPAGLRALPWDDDKFEGAMRAALPSHPLPIAAIYHLRGAEEDAPEPGITPVKGLAAAEVVTASIYRRRIADHIGRTPGYLADAMAIVRTVPAFAFRRSWDLSRFEEEALAVEAHAFAAAQHHADGLPARTRADFAR